MALGKAVLVGAVAALAIPFAMRGATGQLGEWLRLGVTELSLGDSTIVWSWPLFSVVTLFAWGFLAWADR
jgi:hypothetical protein